LKRFLNGLAPQHCEAIYCHLTHLPSAGVLKLLVTQLGELPRMGKDRLYKQILERAAAAEGTLLLVFDEAHLLDANALTDLRLLISSALDIIEDAPGGTGTPASNPRAFTTHRLAQSRLGALPTAATDQRTDFCLHRLPDDEGWGPNQGLRRFGEERHPVDAPELGAPR
jgi:hypothetical protein